MKQHIKPRTLVVALLLASTSSISYAGVVLTDGPDIVLRTDGGFGVRTVDNQFSFNLVGRLNLDTSYSSGVLNNAHQDKSRTETYIRRGFFGVTGTAYQDWYFEAIMNGTGDQGAGAPL